MLPISSPLQQFFGLDGKPLDDGYIYLGQADEDPENVPKTVYWDAAGTQRVAQPIRTSNGYIFRSGKPANVYVSGGYSITIRDKKKRLVDYAANSANFDGSGTLKDDLAAPTGESLIGMQRSSMATAIATTLALWHDAQFVNVKADFGAVGDGVTDDTAAIQAAIDAVSAAGGGAIFFPPGTYLVYKDNPIDGQTTTPDDYALSIQSDYVRLVGAGWSSCIKASRPSTSTPKYTILRVGTLPITNGEVSLTGVRIEHLQFDGSYTPTIGETDDATGTLIWFHGVRAGGLYNVWLHHSGQYGLGLQNGGLQDCTFDTLLIEDTVADGIDTKNNGDVDYGNKLLNVVIRRFGRGSLITDPYAGADLMGPWTVNNIFVSEYGEDGSTPNAGIRFKQGETGEDRGRGGHYSLLTNFYINAQDSVYVDACGVKSSAYDVRISNGTVKGAVGSGILLEQEGCGVSNVTVAACGVGVEVGASAYLTNGDDAGLSNVTARDCTLGFSIGAPTTASNCNALDNTTGIQFFTAAANSQWIGGAIRGNTTQVLNGASNVLLTGTSGFLADGTASLDFSVATTGAKIITIPHGLSITPRATDVFPSISGGSDALRFDTLKVRATDATNVILLVNVTAAGTTATAAIKIKPRSLIGIV